jgi:2-C-methyl-D-erythritol 4-phosphate cytidylyltransferase
MNFAIIVAAGSGKRFGGEIPKQFLEIGGKPLIVHTLEKFENCAAVDATILVLSAAEAAKFSANLEKFHLKKLSKIVSGGATRAESVWNGLRAIDETSAKIVAVHDGARPLVSVEEIAATIAAANEFGAACLVAPVTDTIKKIANGKITKTVDRNSLRRALTPQCFRYEVIKRAFANADLSEAATDECFLVEKLGYEIAVVEGSAKNIKITHREDFILAENLLKQSKF